MNKYKVLWKEKKYSLAKLIAEAPNANIAYQYANELADMEISERRLGSRILELKLDIADENGIDNDTDKFLKEFISRTKPVVEFLKEHYEPHTAVLITSDFVKVVTDELGVPIKEEKNGK